MNKIKEIRVQKSFRLKESTLHMLNRIVGKNDTEKVEYCIDKTYNLVHKEEIQFPFCLELVGLEILDQGKLLEMDQEQLKKLDLNDGAVRRNVLDFKTRQGLIFNVENKTVGFELLEQFGLNANTNVQQVIKEFKVEKINLGITEEIALKLRKEFKFFESSKKETIFNLGSLSEEYIKIEKLETDKLVFTPNKEKIIEVVLGGIIENEILIKDIEDNIKLEKIKIIEELKVKALEIEENLNLEAEKEIESYNIECFDYMKMLDESCTNRENRIAILLQSITDEKILQSISKEYYSYYRIKELIGEQKQSYCIDSTVFNTLKIVEHSLESLSMNELRAFNDIKQMLLIDESIKKFYKVRILSGFKETDTVVFNNNDFDKTNIKRWFNEGDKYFILQSVFADAGEVINVIRLTNWFLVGTEKDK